MDFLDELHRTVSLPDYPQRIVSLVPSVTETLFELGVGERVVGVTSFCTHPPEEIARIEKVGGTKDPQLEDIVRLAPDVVILNVKKVADMAATLPGPHPIHCVGANHQLRYTTSARPTGDAGCGPQGQTKTAPSVRKTSSL